MSLFDKISSSFLHIAQNISWLVGERFIRIVVGLVVEACVARYLGPEMLGLLSYSIAFIALFQIVATLGLQGLVVRELVSKPRSKVEILGTTFFLKLIAGIFFAALASLIIVLMRPNDNTVQVIVFIISTSLIFRSLSTIELWFESQVESGFSVIASITTFLLSSITKVVLILVKASLLSFAILFTVELALRAAGLIYIYFIREGDLFSWKLSRIWSENLLRKSWPLVISGFGAMVYLKIDQVMIGEMAGASEVGIYSAAAKISEAWYFIPAFITASVFPSLIKIRIKDSYLYQARLQTLLDFLLILALMIAIFVSIFSNQIIDILYSGEYYGASRILNIHIWAGLFIFLGAVLSKWLIIEDHIKFSIIRHTFGAIANVLFNSFLIPRYLGIGAAISTVVSYAAASYFACFLSRETLPMAKMMCLAFISPLRLPIQWILSRT